jgi:membrane-associated phospholipid phosphatase
VPHGPIFSDWNYHVLRDFFWLLPHTGSRDTLAQFLTVNALASTCIFSAVFFLFWRMEDKRREWRRGRLLEVVFAFFLAMIVTLAWRPWIGWAAPSLVPRFQTLYPDYFWNDGNHNCFPSHSTLIYLLVAAGFWPFKRWLSALLMLWVLLGISAPRVYVGGHYPIDILAGILIAAIALWMARRICATPRVAGLFSQIITKDGISLDLFLFLWLFELAEGFRSSYIIAMGLARGARNIL